MWSLLVILSISTFTAAEDFSRCPTNLNRDEYLRVYGNRCYQFSIHRHITWSDAVNECGGKGGNLVIVRNLDDQHFIMSALGTYNFNGQGVWIGLSDQQTEGTFRWVTGEPVTFTFWALGQPGSSRRRRLLLDDLKLPIPIPHLGPDEDCVLLKYTDSGHWHDYPCSNLLVLPEHYPYVCEFDMLPIPTTTTTTSAPQTTQTTQPSAVTVPAAAPTNASGTLVVG